MNSNFSQDQSNDGHFPYGNQSSYRDFIMPEALEGQFLLEANMWDPEDTDPVVYARYFYPAWSATWYVTAYDPDYEIFYGFVTGLHYPEWWTWSLREWIDFTGALGLKIERDLSFYPKPFSKAVPESEREIT